MVRLEWGPSHGGREERTEAEGVQASLYIDHGWAAVLSNLESQGLLLWNCVMEMREDREVKVSKEVESFRRALGL